MDKLIQTNFVGRYYDFDTKALDEALYAINRAIDPDPEYRSELQQKLVDARDLVWNVIQTLDPTRKD